MSQDKEALPQFEGWETVEKLGEGGMCAVYRVRRGEEERALKVLYDKQPNAVERFVGEAKLLMGIRHHNIIEVVELNDEARPPWLVMEMLAGYDLEEAFEKGPMQPELAASIFADVAAGLQVVHDMGVMHRDIKPANIMMSADGTPHLIDFGIARDTSKAHLTQQGFVVGTASYLPPEIFVEDDSAEVQDTPTCDVYALGQSLCEVLVGHPVHSRDGSGTSQFAKIVKEKMMQDFLDPRTWRAQVPDELAEVVIAATQAEPEDRIQTAREMGDRLHAWIHARNEKSEAPVTRGFDPTSLPEPPKPPAPRGDSGPQLHPPANAKPPPPPKPSPKESALSKKRTSTPAPVRRKKKRGGKGGLVVSTLGMMMIAGGLLVATGAGVGALWFFKPVAADPPVEAAETLRGVIEKRADAFEPCEVDKAGTVVLKLATVSGELNVGMLKSDFGDVETSCFMDKVVAMDLPAPPAEGAVLLLPLDVQP